MMRSRWLALAATTTLAAGAMSIPVAAADSAWPSVDGDAQHSRQGAAVGPVNPDVKWVWHEDKYVADGGIGGTRTAIPGVLDDSGRLLFKARNTDFDDIDGVSARYDLLGLDPGTGDAKVLLTDVKGDYCVPAVGPDGTIWTFQDVNERTEPATGSNPAHGETGHVDMDHHPEAASWLVGIDPATDQVVHRYSGEGVHPTDEVAVYSCKDALTIAADGTVLFKDYPTDSSSGGFDDWVRAINPDGTSKWEVNVTEEYGDARGWRRTSNWMLVAPEGAPGEGTVYLGYLQGHPDGETYHPALAAFDLDTGALRDTFDLPGRKFGTTPVIDPEGGVVLSIEAPRGSSRGTGHLLRLVDDGSTLGVDWRQDIVGDRDREGSLKGTPESMQLANDRVTGFFGDDLYSFDWSDGDFGWSTDVGLIRTQEVLVDSAGKAYVAKDSAGGDLDPKLYVYSPRGRLVGGIYQGELRAAAGDLAGGFRTIGPLGADGTLFVWGGGTWFALEQGFQGHIPCPAGTSSTVTCTRNPAQGYVMRGTGADETFVGSGQPDKMVGRGGDDVMRAGGRADLLIGGRGNDRLRGHGGADTLVGKGGKDRLVGNGGRDTFKAGKGRDKIKSKGQRRERVNCGAGRDRATGTRGDRVSRNCERVRR